LLLGNDLSNTSFRQGTLLAEKKVPIWPATPGSNGFSLKHSPLTPAFRQVLAMSEIGIKLLTCFLDQRVWSFIDL
jgi:hypothetical protein